MLLINDANIRLTVANDVHSWHGYYESSHERFEGDELTPDKAVHFAKGIVEYFNDTLRPGELPRRLLGVEIKKDKRSNWEVCDGV